MDEIGMGALLGVFAGVVGGAAGGMIYLLTRPRPQCPECGETLTRFASGDEPPPIVRRCRACGCGVDAAGRKTVA